MSHKRTANKKLHQRQRASRTATRPRADAQLVSAQGPPVSFRRPSAYDQMHVYLSEGELELPETTLASLRRLVVKLPFEGAMLELALLQGRLEPIRDDAAGQWKLARSFFGEEPELLARYARARQQRPDWLIFSPQPLTYLMRVLIEDAADEPMCELTPGERSRLRHAVIGAHSAVETALQSMPKPTRRARVAHMLQSSVFFRQSPLLESIARQRELLRLMTEDGRLAKSHNRSPIREWLETDGLTIEQQHATGLALAGMTHAWEEPRPRVTGESLAHLFVLLGLPTTGYATQLPAISASRNELREQFAEINSGPNTYGWELRPFHTSPFLRLASGELLLLAPSWLQSWLSDGFHYRALRGGEKLATKDDTLRFTRLAGEAAELYALDLAQAAGIDKPLAVIGEQPYGKDRKMTTDVALVHDRDLILFEMHGRRIPAHVAVRGTTEAANNELWNLLIRKIDQIGPCVGALLDGNATLTDIDITRIDRVWPVVVTMGYVMQAPDVWHEIRAGLDPEKTAPLRRSNVMPLQILNIDDYEKLMGMVEAGGDLVSILRRKTSGAYRDRDFASWAHGDPAAPSHVPRSSILEGRFGAITAEAEEMIALAQRATPEPPSEQAG